MKFRELCKLAEESTIMWVVTAFICVFNIYQLLLLLCSRLSFFGLVVVMDKVISCIGCILCIHWLSFLNS